MVELCVLAVGTILFVIALYLQHKDEQQYIEKRGLKRTVKHYLKNGER